MSDDEVQVEIHETDEQLGWPRRILRAVVALGVLAGGASVMVGLIRAKPEAATKPAADTAPIVEVTAARVGTQRVEVVATGTVVPARQVVIAAEVGGRVTWLDRALEPGGRFAAGRALLKVDARDYQLAVEQQAAQVTLAATELEVEKGRRRVAEKEWQAFGEQPPAGSLALRDPQLKAAEGRVKAAESGLRRTRLAVAKTGLVAPFNAMVLTRQVDLGQLVVPGTPLATLVGTDQFWVQVTVPVDRLGWLAIPGVGGVAETEGAVATVEQRLGEQTVRRTGRVVRLAGDVDPVGRMARLLVEIDDPLGLRAGAPGLPLLLNSYVDVTLAGREVEGVAEAPRQALRGDDRVWVLDGDRLRMAPVEVVWRRRDTVLLRGLPDGARLVTSPVPAAVDGMRVRGTADAPAANPAPAPAPTPAEGAR